MNGNPNKEFMVELRGMKCIYDYSTNLISLDELYSYVINLIKNKKLICPVSIDVDISNINICDHILFLELETEKDCWNYFRILNKGRGYHCTLLKYSHNNDYYSTSDNFRRLPYCAKCIDKKATHCNRQYCRKCAKTEPSFLEFFYEIPQDVISNVMMKYLNVNDLLKLQITCKNMNDYLNDYRIWKRFMEESKFLFRLNNLDIYNETNNYTSDLDYSKRLFLHMPLIIHHRLHTKSCIIIQKHYRRYKYPKIAMRKIFSKLTYYFNSGDYTRKISDSLRIGTDLKTKIVYDNYDIQFKIRNFIEEPVFD